MRLGLVSCLLVLLSVPAAAQPARTLPAPNATFTEPFSSIGVGMIRELRDGRVIVADSRDRLVSLVDFASGTTTRIGGEGAGPQEFVLPFRLFAAAADTTFLFDAATYRYLIIGPDGKPINTFQTAVGPRAATSSAGEQRVAPNQSNGIAMVGRAVDARGRIYGEGSPLAQGPDGRVVSADSVPLLRFDRATRRMDTLTYVKLPPPAAPPASARSPRGAVGNRGAVGTRIGGVNPLAPRDEWAVFPDGRVAAVRAADYHIDFIMPDGSRRAAPRIPFAPVRMNAAEIRHEEGLRNAVIAARSVVPRGAPPLEPLTDWPAFKPPFRAGFPTVLARPNGELWVRRTEHAQAQGTLYDVITPQGTVAYQVRLAEGITLVGFGNATIYTTRRDADDLVYLQRHVVGEAAVRVDGSPAQPSVSSRRDRKARSAALLARPAARE